MLPFVHPLTRVHTFSRVWSLRVYSVRGLSGVLTRPIRRRLPGSPPGRSALLHSVGGAGRLYLVARSCTLTLRLPRPGFPVRPRRGDRHQSATGSEARMTKPPKKFRRRPRCTGPMHALTCDDTPAAGVEKILKSPQNHPRPHRNHPRTRHSTRHDTTAHDGTTGALPGRATAGRRQGAHERQGRRTPGRPRHDGTTTRRHDRRTRQGPGTGGRDTGRMRHGAGAEGGRRGETAGPDTRPQAAPHGPSTARRHQDPTTAPQGGV